MPAPDRLVVLRAILDTGAVPTFTAPDADAAFDMVAACAEGGAEVVEFTNRGDGAYDVFAALARRVAAELPSVTLGAGTIIDAPTAALFIAAGARFVVGQSYSEEVARLCNRRRIAYIPGCGTATEIAAAEELGCEIVKLFPAAAYDGPAFVRNFLAPSPGSRVMPTNVLATEEATRAWFEAGAAALGVAGHLYPADLIAARDRAEITARTRRFLGWVREARAAG
jgi:2-dehydro-3-deoxyphosphogluconate aldolase/(4S)-4-hydroxy-2-oxoglutarate aldolase